MFHSCCRRKPFPTLAMVAFRWRSGKGPPLDLWVRSFPRCLRPKISPLPTLASKYPFSRGFLDTRKGRAFSTNTGSTLPQIHSRHSLTQAQLVLMDYLHWTSGLDIADAEHVSRNSPVFLSKLLRKVEHDHNISASISRFLRYHPIDEFEPLFESIGVAPHQLQALLRREVVFLRDDPKLMENLKFLCCYGFAREKMGRMCTKAFEIFGYDPRILACKLEAYENIGLGKSDVIKVISACPDLLVGDVDENFIRLLKELKSIGISPGWIANNVHAEDTYNWHRMTSLVTFLGELGFSQQAVGMLIEEKQGFLLDDSGKYVFQVVGMFLKLGAARDEIKLLLSTFSHVKVCKYLKNIQTSLCFLIDIGMELEDIKMILRSQQQQLGSCELLKPVSVITLLAIGGKKNLCEIIKRDPGNLSKYVKGAKLEPFWVLKEGDAGFLLPEKSLPSLDSVSNGNDAEMMFHLFQEKDYKVQERYNFLRSKGFEHSDITKMVKAAPRVIRQSLQSLRCKIDFLFDRLDFPIKFLVRHPGCLQYSFERMKARFLMYNWLQSEGKVKGALMLGTILRLPDELFIKLYVSRHSEGLEVWDKFRKGVYES